MFKKLLISVTILWIFFASGCFFLFQSFYSKGKIAYHNLVSFQHEEKDRDQPAKRSRQTRTQVRKQIFFKKNNDRLQTRISSEQSELFFHPKGEKAEVVEHFKNLVCMMQDNFTTEKSPLSNLQTNQYIRHFQALNGRYFYQSGQMEAEGVCVSHYLIPGLEWPATLDSFHPLLRGHAKELQFSILNDISMKAQGFQAAFYNWEDKW